MNQPDKSIPLWRVWLAAHEDVTVHASGKPENGHIRIRFRHGVALRLYDNGRWELEQAK